MVEAILRELPPEERSEVLRLLTQEAKSEADLDIERKQFQRAAGAAIIIPDVVDPVRRERCLADPELFLMTYGAPKPDVPLELQPGTFWMPWAAHHHSMIDAMYCRAESGGDKAIAAPRGGGKSTIISWMLIYIVLNEMRFHPAGFGATNAKAKEKLFDSIVYQLKENDLLLEDFPEVCWPIRKLGNNAKRALNQHVDGVRTNVVCSQKQLVLPAVPGSPYGGCSFSYYGFDTAFRGGRHDFAAIDDPETDQVAHNEELNRKLEKLIDGSVVGLKFPGSTIPRVVITTIQNRHCLSFRVTSRDPAEGGKPTFEGDRHGQMITWPENQELWDEYIALRQLAQGDPDKPDKDAKVAVDFYLANMEEMKRGATVANPYEFDQKNPAELDAIQAFFNRIADWGLARVMAELQNDPEEEETESTIGLTPGLVASRISGLNQNCLPTWDGEIKIAGGCDVGNRVCHWGKIAFFGNAVGVIIDEGEFAIANMVKNPDQAFLTKAIQEALTSWRTNVMSENPYDLCFVDSGDGHHQEAVYEFVRQTGGGIPFAPSKGWEGGRFTMPKIDTIGNAQKGFRVFEECYAKYFAEDNIWLYQVHTEHWKEWAQQRFVTPTFDSNQKFLDGSLSVFSPKDGDPKRWLEFSNHICSEGRETLFVPGKGYKSEWKVYNKNNHKLDWVALACAAAGCLGVRLIQRVSMATKQHQANKDRPKPRKTLTMPDGRAFLATERR